jgi:hypothetical protein
MIHRDEAQYATNEIQALVVTVKTKGQSITFAAAYCLPRYNLKKTDYLNFLSSLGERLMVRGDNNAKKTQWGSRLTTCKGKELPDAIKEYGCVYRSTDEKKMPDLLEFFITKTISAKHRYRKGLRINFRPA